MTMLRQYESGITIGEIPDAWLLKNLALLDFVSVIDLRKSDDPDRIDTRLFCKLHNLLYLDSTFANKSTYFDDILTFYLLVFNHQNQPTVAFSRSGYKPLILLLLYDAVLVGQPLDRVFTRARAYSIPHEDEEDVEAHTLIGRVAADQSMQEAILKVARLRALYPSKWPEPSRGCGWS